MRITSYNVKINRETKRSELIKEKAVNYSAYKKLQCAEHIVNALNDLLDLQNMAEEYMYLLTLNTKGDITGIFEISHGTVSNCLVSPREIFSRALMIGATTIILVHNHPSGYPEPSHDDILLTERVKKAGELIGIELLDHIIIGDKCFISFRREEILANL